MSHTSRASGLATLGLLAPIVLADSGGRITTAGACLLLVVESSVTASSADGMGLRVALTKALRSLCLKQQ